VEGGALFIISGDHHLLDQGHHRGIQIFKPKAFLTLLSRQQEEQEGAS
jgi:predicted nucleic acid-binding protein